MNHRIAGCGWITPFGAELLPVWQRVVEGEVADSQAVTNPESGRTHRFVAIPPKLVDALGRNPRLRRSSAISYFGVAAGLAALENAGLELNPALAERTAVIFAICDGGVQYTRRFYDQIVKQGANCASPVLFPETVYNAPASHLSALLGINGASYTLVGDASVGLSALHLAGQLLDTMDIDQCVVVGAEECDWILCEAYQGWRLAHTPLAEGAAAVVVNRSGPLSLRTHPGLPFFRQSEAASAIDQVLAELARGGPADLAIASANGSFIDAPEAAALNAHFHSARRFFPKRAFGEAPGAGALMQTVAAALAIHSSMANRALVSVLGFNQQASGAVLERLP